MKNARRAVQCYQNLSLLEKDPFLLRMKIYVSSGFLSLKREQGKKFHKILELIVGG